MMPQILMKHLTDQVRKRWFGSFIFITLILKIDPAFPGQMDEDDWAPESEEQAQTSKNKSAVAGSPIGSLLFDERGHVLRSEDSFHVIARPLNLIVFDGKASRSNYASYEFGIDVAESLAPDFFITQTIQSGTAGELGYSETLPISRYLVGVQIFFKNTLFTRFGLGLRNAKMHLEEQKRNKNYSSASDEYTGNAYGTIKALSIGAYAGFGFEIQTASKWILGAEFFSVFMPISAIFTSYQIDGDRSADEGESRAKHLGLKGDYYLLPSVMIGRAF